MATLKQVVDAGRLVRIEGDLDAGQRHERLIYAFPRMISWAETELLRLRSALNDTLEPHEQFVAIVTSFTGGEELVDTIQFRKMRPVGAHIWELKTADLRIFGWFYRRGVFIASSMNDASRIKDYRLYPALRDQAVADRVSIDLDPPPCIESEDYADVL